MMRRLGYVLLASLLYISVSSTGFAQAPAASGVSGQLNGYYLSVSGSWSRSSGQMNSYGIDGYGHDYNVGGARTNLDLFVASKLERSAFQPQIRVGYDQAFGAAFLGGGLDLSIGSSKLSRCHGFSNARYYYYGGASPSTCGDSWGVSAFDLASGPEGLLFAKLGYQLSRLSIYSIGGLSAARVKSTVTINCDMSIGGCGANDNVNSGTISSSKTRIGWSLGFGLEFNISERLGSYAEYRRTSLGTTSLRFMPSSWSGISAAGHSTKLSNDRVSFGISYKL